MEEIRIRLERLTRAGAVREQEKMAAHTTFRIGGPADYFVTAGNMDELSSLLGLCREQELPCMILGNGSNLLVGDKGIDGVVIRLDGELSSCRVLEDGRRIRAGAGAKLSAVARSAMNAGLTGLEFAAGIPGTLGGAMVMNAGAYGREMKDVTVSVRVLTEDGRDLWLKAEELELGYRTSCIPACGYVVAEVVLELEPGVPEEIEKQMRELAVRRREKQPLEYASAGSTFKRPEGHFAGKLIQDAGLAGLQVGGARVSEKHCGFVINTGEATAADVMRLCAQVQEEVRARFGVELEMEIKRVGKF